MSIVSDLRTTGVADVLVVLRLDESATKTSVQVPASVARHFIQVDNSRDAEILRLLRSRQRIVESGAEATTSAVHLGAGKASSKPVRFFPHLGLALGTVDREGLKGLRQEKAVAKIVAAPELRLIRPVARAAATAPTATYSWGLKRLKVDVLREQHRLTGKGVLIGHLDTGVDGAHPALKGAIAEFAFFDALGNLRPGAPTADSDDHGTHTAGTIAGRAVGGVQFGVAPEAKLASAAVIEGGKVIARILAGMDWAVGKKVRILSMSLGLIGTAETFRTLTKILRAKGVLPVFAVGNEGPGSSRYPGNYPEALSVGAIDGNDDVADFSSSQQFVRRDDPIVPDLVAPGVEVVSCAPGGGYQSMDGTSMATPHIAGLAALLMQAEPSATVDQIEAAIFQSCQRGSMRPERANRGCPDGVAALNALRSMAAPAASAAVGKKRAHRKLA
ncbi:Subtilase family protein [Janthinobacterium sp. TND4EL3]|uniref:S8 family peptidase n=1 Tax=Janthinobacterium sp. TND4EL3 TaxID=1907311 RepID=UPI000953B7FC|nr:S8 family serine peptidase [Janthinobacterium sp. TND4EL3]SIR87925.1 Subtilase family protein [Janthinobacterium sp. TND4EL3]